MYPEKKGGSYKMARPQQNWGLLTLLTRWASIWTMPNTASPKSESPCGRAVYAPARATILGHPPQKTAPGGRRCRRIRNLTGCCSWTRTLLQATRLHTGMAISLYWISPLIWGDKSLIKKKMYHICKVFACRHSSVTTTSIIKFITSDVFNYMS